MSISWIKIETATPEKPEVWQIAEELGIDPDAVVGKLIRVWIWFDEQTENGNAPSVTKMLLDRKVGVTGFCDCLISAGWLHEESGEIMVINFERHNGKTAKKRALTAQRVARHKANARVTPDALPREEKRRVKKNNKKESSRFTPPTPKEVQDYLDEKGITGFTGQRFVDHYAASGWKRGNTKIKSWKHCVSTWQQRHGDGQSVFGEGNL